MKQAVIFLIFISAFFTQVSAEARENNVQKYINQLKQDTLYTNAAVSIMVMDEKGRNVASWNPDMPLLTASTMKTISTGMALRLLGPEYRFTTKIGYTGYIKDGVLNGDLYIIGGGDPTLGSRDTVAYPIDSIFGIWAESIKLAGIATIKGNIIGDERYFENEIIPESWAISNLGPTFGSGPSGLAFMENTQEFKFVHSGVEGDAVNIVGTYPVVPGMIIENDIKVAPKKSGDRSSYHTTDLARVIRFSGTVPADREIIEFTGSNKFPGVSCAEEFRKYLLTQNIKSNALSYDSRIYKVAPYDQIQVIGETKSPKLASIVNVTNRISNNFYAETLFKTIGKTITGTGSYDSSRVAVLRHFKEMGLSSKGYTQVDGSGLSRQNYVSARFFCKYFSLLKESNTFGDFFKSLPQPGGPGTLKNVLTDMEPAVKSRLHAKSGSLSNVKCYAGYVERQDGGMYYFAILTNNYSARTAQMQVGIEGFMKELLK